MRKALICAFACSAVMLFAVASANAGKQDRPGGGYCPAGTCNMKGEDGGAVFDLKTCSKKYCAGNSNSGKKK